MCRVRWVGRIACMTTRNTYKNLVGNPEEKRPLGRPRCRYEGNIKVYIKIDEGGGAVWPGPVSSAKGSSGGLLTSPARPLTRRCQPCTCTNGTSSPRPLEGPVGPLSSHGQLHNFHTFRHSRLTRHQLYCTLVTAASCQ
jgi:hypothetical protein